MSDIVLSITMLSALALLGGAFYLWRYRGVVKQAVLMAVLALVMITNVAIWVIPVDNGESLQGEAAATR